MIETLPLEQPLERSLWDITAESGETLRRVLLTEHLLEQKLYDRVMLRWREVDSRGLTAALLEQCEWLTSVYLDRDEFSDESFTSLCVALSSNCHVQDLTVHTWHAMPPQVRDLLKQNESLRSVKLVEGCSGPGASLKAVLGLASNKNVQELSLACLEIDHESARRLAQLLQTNDVLRKVTVSCQHAPDPKSLAVIAEGLLQNQFVTNFSFTHGTAIDCSTQSMLTAVQRNTTFLHRAVRFVLGKNTDKLCAEAFELYEFKPSLIPAVMSNSTLTEAEARFAASSARRFIHQNYLFINRLVHQQVECYPGHGTQIDQLNEDCWLVVVKYLKVSDVVAERSL